MASEKASFDCERLREILGPEAEEDPALLDYFYALDYLPPDAFEFLPVPGECAPALLLRHAEDLAILNLFLLDRMPPPAVLKPHFRPGLHIHFPCVPGGGDARMSHRLKRHLLPPGRRRVFPIPECIRAQFRDEKSLVPLPGKLELVTHHVALFFEGELVAYAATQFQSRRFAEVGVETQPRFQGKGHGAQALSLLCEWILERGQIPVYITAEENLASLALCRKVGFEYHGDLEELVLG